MLDTNELVIVPDALSSAVHPCTPSGMLAAIAAAVMSSDRPLPVDFDRRRIRECSVECRAAFRLLLANEMMKMEVREPAPSGGGAMRRGAAAHPPPQRYIPTWRTGGRAVTDAEIVLMKLMPIFERYPPFPPKDVAAVGSAGAVPTPPRRSSASHRFADGPGYLRSAGFAGAGVSTAAAAAAGGRGGAVPVQSFSALVSDDLLVPLSLPPPGCPPEIVNDTFLKTMGPKDEALATALGVETVAAPIFFLSCVLPTVQQVPLNIAESIAFKVCAFVLWMSLYRLLVL